MTAHPNRPKNDALDATEASGLPDEMFRLLEQLHDHGTYAIEPRPRDAGDDRPAKPVITITVDSPAMVSASTIALRVTAGERGAHREATHATQNPVPLEEYSAEAEYFISFHFPRFGTRFFMVAQTYRRHDVADRLLRLVKHQSFENRKEKEERQKEARRLIRAAGGTLPKKEVFHKLTFDKFQASDDAYLDEILGAAKSISATFTAVAPDTRGSGSGKRIEKTLTISLTSASGRDAGIVLGKGWKRRRRSQDPDFTRRTALKQLGDELQKQGLVSEDELDGYDNSKLSIHAPTAPTAVISADTMRDVFTYPVSDGKPSAYYFFKKVSDRLSTIALQEDVEIEDVDFEEVDRCLDVST